MSHSQEEGTVSSGSAGPSGTVQTAAHEAAGVASTAKDEAAGVVETAKAEAGAVAHEAKDQVRELYHQTTAQLKDQAAEQQRRVADGLRSVGGELESMSQNSEGGVASDLVRQASTRIQGIAGWIGDRDPGSLLTEVKSYARAKPGTFIAVAALAGLVAGRLTRALSEGASSSSGASGSVQGTTTGPEYGVSTPVSGGYAGTAAGAGISGQATAVGADSALGGSADGGAGTLGASGTTGIGTSGTTGVGASAATEAHRQPPFPTDPDVPAAPDGLSGVDTGTAPWGVSGEGDARHGEAADTGTGTPLFDRTDAAHGGQGEERP